MPDLIYKKSLEYLKTDPFKNLPTLKYLSLYKDSVNVNLLEDGPNWAVVVTVPTAILSYDSANYPGAKKAVFINGTSEQLKHGLLASLSDSNYILRLNENLDLAPLKSRFKVNKGHAYISYSCQALKVIDVREEVPGNISLTDDAIDMIKRNGYSEDEIRRHFENGSAWFGFAVDNKIVSSCFVYRNYEDIWEIAGVHTLEQERKNGYGRVVVASALKYLLERNLIPRYEAEIRNTNSQKLAESLGMERFLRLDHFLLDPL